MDRLLKLLAKIDSLTADERTELGTLLAAEALAALTGEELEQVYAALGTATDAVAGSDSPEAVATIETLAAGYEAVTVENTRREDAQAEADTQRQAALDRIAAVREPAAADGTDATTDAAATDAAATDTTDGAAADGAADTTAAAVAEPVAAAAALPVQRPARLGRMAGVQRQAAPAQATARPQATSTIVAGAGLEAHEVGATIPSIAELAREFGRRTENLAAGDGIRTVVASIRAEIPESRWLRPGGDTMAQIDAVVAAVLAGEENLDALVASGGFCAPVAPRYDVLNISTASRPVRDGLVQFGAERGGITFVPPPALVNLAAAITEWTAANDVALNAPATKAKFQVVCGAPVTVTLEAIVARLGIGNLMARAFPERVAAYIALALAAHARIAEIALLTAIDAASSKRTAGPVLSATRDILFEVGLAAAGYRKRHRMAQDAVLDCILPGHLQDELAGDIARQLPGDGTLAQGNDEVNGYLRSRNVRPIWTLDENVSGFPTGPAAGAAATALPNYPTTAVWRLFAPGTHLFLDGGRLDLGLMRDSVLNATNDAESFVETFEGLAMVGVESMSVTSTLAPNGTSAGATAVASVTGV
jgi:hypothetical protein